MPSTCWCSVTGCLSVPWWNAPGWRGDEAEWVPSESTRFGLYARHVWDGLLSHEEIVDR